jgi:hypothetical protein
MVRSSKDLLFAAATHRIRFAKGAVNEEWFVSVAEACAL